jgi:hypothetical protein
LTELLDIPIPTFPRSDVPEVACNVLVLIEDVVAAVVNNSRVNVLRDVIVLTEAVDTVRFSAACDTE